ncbi:MAG: hypothetical protein ABI707_00200 [Ferruginibacter sp.]
MITINLAESNNYTGKRLDTLNQILVIIQTVLNSDQFKNEVLNFQTDGSNRFYFQKNFFDKWLDIPYTNQEIYNIIMNGVETPGNTGDSIMDLYLALVNGSDGDVIGYSNPGTKEIFTYSVMFDGMKMAELANHYAHEWCHKLGFTHSFQRNRLRNNSVPYAIGNIVEKIADSLVP